MARKLKNAAYFLVARYFRFFARIRLAHWHPRIVVVTGSNGKTTALELIATQLKSSARYTRHANSSFGIPFDILDLHRGSYSLLEWPLFALLAPVRALGRPYAEAIYVVEADCDRPYEGEFLSALLRPEVTVWLSSARTHSMNFDRLVRAGAFASVDEAIAHEFGNFLARTSKLSIVNADSPLIMGETARTKAEISGITEQQLTNFGVSLAGTEFEIAGTAYRAPYLLPKEVFYAIAASVKVAEYFNIKPITDLSALSMPPGRSSIFKGLKNTTIIDSTYNIDARSLEAILRMTKQLPGKKWLILGDMTEQGAQEKEEHERAARIVSEAGFERIILVGPRLKAYALPLLNDRAISFEQPHDALDYLKAQLAGGETLVFKGARFLEGVVEHLLADSSDAAKLCRREAVWQKRRVAWGL